MEHRSKITLLKKLMIFEGMRIPANQKDEFLKYHTVILFFSNIILLIACSYFLLYSVKTKSYYPAIFGGLASYLMTRIPFVCIFEPKFYAHQTKQGLWLLVVLVAVFLLILLMNSAYASSLHPYIALRSSGLLR